MEDKLQKIFPLFQRYRIDSYLNREVFDRQEQKDLRLIWATIFITLLVALLIIFAFFR